MEKVFVITANSWNGEHDVVTVVGVFDEATARAFIEERKPLYESTYSTTYEMEEFVFNRAER